MNEISLKRKLFYLATNRKIPKNKRVNLYYWSPYGFKENVGDYLSYVIVKEMLKRKNIPIGKRVIHTKSLFAIGSILKNVCNEGVVWGSGLHGMNEPVDIEKKEIDIRLVRGPITRSYLISKGHNCPEKYGDPALVLSALFPELQKYKNSSVEYVLVANLLELKRVKKRYPNEKILSTSTYYWKRFIKKILSAKKVISTSLHGIIIAESFGIPAVYLRISDIDESELKFRDYYEGTQRTDIVVTKTLKEALDVTPMALPEIPDDIIETFPYDIWE